MRVTHRETRSPVAAAAAALFVLPSYPWQAPLSAVTEFTFCVPSLPPYSLFPARQGLRTESVAAAAERNPPPPLRVPSKRKTTPHECTETRLRKRTAESFLLHLFREEKKSLVKHFFLWKRGNASSVCFARDTLDMCEKPSTKASARSAKVSAKNVWQTASSIVTNV